MGTTFVVVEKDATDPVITINSPISDQIFGNNTPSYNISIDDSTSVTCW